MLRRVALPCLVLLLTAPSPVWARGGLHGDGGGRGDPGGARAPAYVLVSVASATDGASLKAALDRLTAGLPEVSGRLAADGAPETLEGTKPERVVMLRFDSLERAQAWTRSDAFREAASALHRTATATIQILAGLPGAGEAGGRGGHGRVHFDQKAFEPFVKKNDATLSRLKGICSGC
ncbi:DUF1330 domain-containing protein [Methylobacterium sp. JK268]